MLPRIKIKFLNGQLGVTEESKDGLAALVTGATAVSSTFELNKAYTIMRKEGLDSLGVTSENNPSLVKLVEQFYSVAEEGTELVVFGVEKTTKMTALCDKTTGKLRDLIMQMKGELRAIVVARDPGEEEVSVTEGLDPDVLTAVPKAQEIAEWATDEMYAPVVVALEGRSYSDAAELKDLTELECNRVAVVIGDVEASSEGAAMGYFAGKFAVQPVQRNIGRVRDGALGASVMYLGDKKVEDAMDDIATIYDKGYITPRTYAGRTGYFWTDDCMATATTDDYAHLTNRRVADKAYRIAYDTLLNYMLEEVDVNTDGTMQDAILKSWQADVEGAIDEQMTANGELSADDAASTGGCKCTIDASQNVLSTSTVKAVLKIRPFGYARYIDVELGFLVEEA